NRSTRKLHLTEAGRIYYEHGLRIREELESAEARVQSVSSQPMGQLKVSAQVSFGCMYLAAPTTAFLRRYPDVSV
ncbi:LysR family transcriptional regulator, partial [Cobetia marina]